MERKKDIGRKEVRGILGVERAARKKQRAKTNKFLF